MSHLFNLIGFLAAALTTLAFVPQVYQVWTSRSARDISLAMYSTFVSGVALWLVYGLMIQAWPVIIANAITLLLAGAILGMKWRFDRR